MLVPFCLACRRIPPVAFCPSCQRTPLRVPFYLATLPTSRTSRQQSGVTHKHTHTMKSVIPRKRLLYANIEYKIFSHLVVVFLASHAHEVEVSGRLLAAHTKEGEIGRRPLGHLGVPQTLHQRLPAAVRPRLLRRLLIGRRRFAHGSRQQQHHLTQTCPPRHLKHAQRTGLATSFIQSINEEILILQSKW
jgi:hypothetical protein